MLAVASRSGFLVVSVLIAVLTGLAPPAWSDPGRSEAELRAALARSPDDIDARIGLGRTLARQGRGEAALEVLRQVEVRASGNPQFLSALAEAYRASGDDHSAFETLERAVDLDPDNPALRSALEAVARADSHAVTFTGQVEDDENGSTAYGGVLAGDLRVVSRLHVSAAARVRDVAAYTDAIGGGGLRWRFRPQTTVIAAAMIGRNNVALPNQDMAAAVRQDAGATEVGFGFRYLSFSNVDTIALSPSVGWDLAGRGRLDLRYTYSSSDFLSGPDGRVDHSGLVRGRWRAWSRAWLLGTYAYGIGNFDLLTVDRIHALRNLHTAGTGVEIGWPGWTRIATSWEHEWREDRPAVDRLVVTLVEIFP